MKRFVTVCILCISWVIAYAQQGTTTVRKVKVSNDGTMGLDTNKLAVDEQGNKLHYYQYKPLLMSGQYGVSSRGPNGTLLNEYLLVKRDNSQNLQIYEMVKKQLAIKSAMLQEGSKLSVEPLKHLIKAEEFEGKAIVLIFFTADCDQCNMGLISLDSFFKQVYDPKKMIIVAVNNRSKEETYDQLKLTPLPYTRIIYDAYKVKDAYWIPTTNAFIVTDKNHVIQFTASGGGGIVDSVLKSKILSVLNQ
jgi:hypothetical protein